MKGTWETIETERLIGDRLTVDHLDDLCRIHRDPMVMATLIKVRSNEWTQQFLQNNLEHWERHHFGLWMFRDRSTAQFVARAGLKHYRLDETDEVELAYALMPAFWGQGLATEIAQAIVKIGFEQLHLSSIICFTLTTNRASQRVMQKVGFQYERNFSNANLPHVLYRLNAAEWSRIEASQRVKHLSKNFCSEEGAS